MSHRQNPNHLPVNDEGDVEERPDVLFNFINHNRPRKNFINIFQIIGFVGQGWERGHHSAFHFRQKLSADRLFNMCIYFKFARIYHHITDRRIIDKLSEWPSDDLQNFFNIEWVAYPLPEFFQNSELVDASGWLFSFFGNFFFSFFERKVKIKNKSNQNQNHKTKKHIQRGASKKRDIHLSVHYAPKKFVGTDDHKYVASSRKNGAYDTKPKTNKPWINDCRYGSQNDKKHTNSNIIKDWSKQSSAKFACCSEDEKSGNDANHNRKQEREVAGKYRGKRNAVIWNLSIPFLSQGAER